MVVFLQARHQTPLAFVLLWIVRVAMLVEAVAHDPRTFQELSVVVSHWLLPQGRRCSVGIQGQACSDGWRVAEVAVPALVVLGGVSADWRGWASNSRSQEHELHTTTAIPANYLCTSTLFHAE